MGVSGREETGFVPPRCRFPPPSWPYCTQSHRKPAIRNGCRRRSAPRMSRGVGVSMCAVDDVTLDVDLGFYTHLHSARVPPECPTHTYLSTHTPHPGLRVATGES
jgi:hypothetical protein